jgi:preprotein translocase subunit SecE
MNFTKLEMQVTTNRDTDTYKLLAASAIFLIALIAFYFLSDFWLLVRISVLLVATVLALSIALKTGVGSETLEFIRGARSELRRVVWPTRSETIQNTLIVVAMVVVIGLLLWVLDLVLFWLVQLVTG